MCAWCPISEAIWRIQYRWPELPSGEKVLWIWQAASLRGSCLSDTEGDQPDGFPGLFLRRDAMTGNLPHWSVLEDELDRSSLCGCLVIAGRPESWQDGSGVCHRFRMSFVEEVLEIAE